MAKKKSRKTSSKGLRAQYGGFIDPYRQSYTTDELMAYRRKYAKMVNQRIVRLERAGYSISDHPAVEYLTKRGRKRFSETPGFKGGRDELKREISVLTGFASSMRSTREGIQKIVAQTSKTIRENYGVQLSGSEMEFLLKNFNDFKSAVKMNSDALLQALGEVSGDITNKDQIRKIIAELKDKKTVKSQAAAIYDALYKGKKGAPKRAGKVAAIRTALRS